MIDVGTGSLAVQLSSNGEKVTLFKEFENWRFEYFERDIDPSTLPDFADLIALWQSKRAGRKVPRWSDFDFYDFKGWHGWINVYEVTHDPFDYVVRLSGSRIDALYGHLTQGLDRAAMNEVYAEEVIRDEHDEFCCRNLYIAYITGPLNVKERTFQEVSYLELPLSDNGEMATHTIEAVKPK